MQRARIAALSFTPNTGVLVAVDTNDATSSDVKNRHVFHARIALRSAVRSDPLYVAVTLLSVKAVRAF